MTAPSAHASKGLILACLAAVYIVWGTTYYALKVGVQGGAGPCFLIGTRFVAAGALLLIWLKIHGTRMPRLRQWANSALLGLLMLAIGIGGVTLAEKTVSSGAAVALISVLPLAIALWSGVLEKWPGREQWLAIGIGLAGTLVMVTGADLRASPGGTALILLSTTTWSLGTVLSRRLDVPHGAMGFAAEMFAGGLVALVMSAAFGEHWVLPHSAPVWWAWAYLVVFGSLIAFSAYRILVEQASPTLASTYAYVNPPVALFVGWWLGDESFSANVFIGLPIVLSAVALHTWSQLRATAMSAATSNAPAADPKRDSPRTPAIAAD
jgi:drug/metabolite transporter (DMT)-like permease